ncbi:hypothetical protein FFLO_02403 [Filobasidium floriforme]|uniref:Uncharacterized protein n=1 Tax=Filobasidium floriforme TaxID=5210 RepID=A0A8K0JSU5_9TREE|nr:uncharacterized protein HD553DRAFT_324949 [Filobasidium floriforme]KAG7562121.1 hypothetical protein FFLO_02403 [Filobasidium floriforme]KAH8082687.1 hypothetical protein HD553DRAFT_324949 [Filobasidium floriforme]
MAEYPKPGSYWDTPNPYSGSEPDIRSGDGSGILPWDDNALDPGNFGPNAYRMDDWTDERFDWNTGTVFMSGVSDTQSSTEHTVDPSSWLATLNNPLSISTNCVNPATSTASVSPSEGVGILQWKQMDRASQNRLKRLYTQQYVKEGDEDDLKLRRDIWQSLCGKSTEAVMLNKQEVFSRVCNAESLRGKKCDAILVVYSMDAEVEWSCFKCNNREASRKVRWKKRQNKAHSDKDTGGRRVIVDQTRNNADSEDRTGWEVIGWETRDTSTDSKLNYIYSSTCCEALLVRFQHEIEKRYSQKFLSQKEQARSRVRV